MAIQQEEQLQSKRERREGKTTSANRECRTHVAAGDRLYKRHLDATEVCNLLDEALNEYARALEQSPDSPDVIIRMAKVLMRKGDFGKADRYANKALALLHERHRNDSAVRREASTLLAQLQYNAGHLEKAAQTYHHAIALGGFESCRARVGYFQATRDLARTSGGLQGVWYGLQAAYALGSALLLFPFERERMSFAYLALLLPQLLLAWLAEEFSGHEAALERYLRIHRQYPGLASVAIIIGDIYREKNDTDKARYWFTKVLERHPASLDAHYHLARLQEQREEYDAMAETYRQLIRMKPGDAHLHCNLGNAYYYAQNYKQALVAYDTALHLGGEARWKAMVAQNLGNIHADYMQNNEAAIAYYQMARMLDPGEVENYIQLGLLYFQQDDYQNAEVIYRQALAVAPEHARLYSNLGYLRWMEGDIENALQFYEKAIALDEKYEIPLNNMGVIYLDSLGQVFQAIELFERAIAVNENYALAYYNLGRAHSFLNNRLEAANCFRMAQDLNQYSKELDNEELTARINSLFESDVL